MVQAETLRKSVIGRLVVRSAATTFVVGVALVSTAISQESNQQRYAPPVHVQPAAWSVLEGEPDSEVRQASAVAQVSPSPFPRSRSAEIASMSQYMRMQNEAVTRAQDAQVNAALQQLQHSQSMAARGNSAPVQQRRQQYAYPAARVATAPQPRTSQPRQQVQSNAVRTAPAPNQIQQQSRQQVSVRQVPRPAQSAQQQVQQPTQRRVGIGLQDRIANAFRNKFGGDNQNATQNVNRPIAAAADSNNGQNIQLTQHLVEAPVEPAPQRTSQRPASRSRKPERAPQLEYRPKNPIGSEKVIVPSFVETNADTQLDSLPELALTSTQEPIGSGVRRPKVTSRSQPMSYRSNRSQQQVSVFRNASAQEESTENPSAADRPNPFGNGFNPRRSVDRENELPQRPSEDKPSLLNMDDEDTAEEARRARSQRDREIDSMDDDGFDGDDILGDEDDEDGPPIFDERGCEELRSLLLGKSIRDIALDISPPASLRRIEMGNVTRSWTDASGNVLATGTMTDLRRGYVILDSGIKLPYARLSEADWAAIAKNWLLPSVCSVGQRGTLGRYWAPQTVTWHASSLCHKPLYFENVQLERYGHSRGPFMQPIHSTFHFFGSLIFLPYNTAIHPPNECTYSLGYYRPGNCAPWLIDPIPFSRDGIRRQALVSLGMAFIP